MHDLRGEGPHLHEVVEDRRGTRFLQSGPIDENLLCHEHEAATQAADRYGIDFCRRVLAQVPQNGETAEVPNPDPQMLVRFACQMIWRYCASKFGRGERALGPYADVLRSITFGGNLPLPVMLLARNHLRADTETEATMAIAPFPVRLAGIRCWLFVVSGVQFFLKLDNRRLPGEREGYAANGADPVKLVQLDPRIAHEVPILNDLLANMARK